MCHSVKGYLIICAQSVFLSSVAAGAIDCSKERKYVVGDLLGSLVNCDGRRTYFLGAVWAENM